jgi:transcriptional regulator with XRE-family HTH domain
MNIGLKIKELRKKRGITQERLAEYLNISSQAVSKWENGTALPDITYVPKLAAFFSVSTDELFSMKPDTNDKRLAEYKNKIRALKKKYDYKTAAAVAENALNEYPSNYEIMIELAQALYHSRYDKKRSKEELKKLISLCERIIDDCTDLSIHQDAVHYVCDAYVENGQREKAVALVENIVLPYETIERSWLLETVYVGEKKIEQSQKNLLNLVDWTVNQLIGLSTNEEMGPMLTFDEKIQFAKTVLDIYSAVFYNGHKNASSGQFRHIYERISELYLGKGDTENGIKYLKLAAQAAEYYDKACEGEEKYNTLFVNRLCADSQKHYLDAVRLLQLMDGRKAFDIIRETDEFKQTHAHLEALSPKE